MLAAVVLLRCWVRERALPESTGQRKSTSTSIRRARRAPRRDLGGYVFTWVAVPGIAGPEQSDISQILNTGLPGGSIFKKGKCVRYEGHIVYLGA